jgi:YVTN family beta-propeller protein
MNVRIPLILCGSVVIGILIGVAVFDYSTSATITSQTSFQTDTVYGYGLANVEYTGKVLSPVAINEIGARSGNLDLSFDVTPTHVSITFCNVRIFSGEYGTLQVSGCLQIPSLLNESFSGPNDSIYSVISNTIDVPTSTANNEGLEANITYEANSVTNTYSYNLFLHSVLTISVKGSPRYEAFDSSNDNMYITSYASNTVSEISSSSNLVVARIARFDRPLGIAFDPSYDELYVNNFGNGTVSVINGTSNVVLGLITVGPDPFGVAYDPTNQYVYVTSNSSNTVLELNATSNTVAAILTDFNKPKGIVFDPSDNDLYIANSGNRTISLINAATNSWVANVKVDPLPESLAYDEANKEVFVGASSFLDVLNGTSLVAQIATSSGGVSVGFDTGNGFMYASEVSSDIVLLFNSSLSRVGTIQFGSAGLGLAYDPENLEMYLAHPLAENVVLLTDNDTT